jgi:hypothetical protein
MMDKPKCVKCNAELKWGGFARNQDTCWDCTKEKALDILEKLSGEERELFVWAMTIVADRHGYEF